MDAPQVKVQGTGSFKSPHSPEGTRAIAYVRELLDSMPDSEREKFREALRQELDRA